jgi:hypothetical protein
VLGYLHLLLVWGWPLIVFSPKLLLLPIFLQSLVYLVLLVSSEYPPPSPWLPPGLFPAPFLGRWQSSRSSSSWVACSSRFRLQCGLLGVALLWLHSRMRLPGLPNSLTSVGHLPRSCGVSAWMVSGRVRYFRLSLPYVWLLMLRVIAFQPLRFLCGVVPLQVLLAMWTGHLAVPLYTLPLPCVLLIYWIVSPASSWWLLFGSGTVMRRWTWLLVGILVRFLLGLLYPPL